MLSLLFSLLKTRANEMNLLPHASHDAKWFTHITSLFLTFNVFLNILFLSDLYTPRGSQTHNLEVKSCMLYRPSHPGALTNLTFICVTTLESKGMGPQN